MRDQVELTNLESIRVPVEASEVCDLRHSSNADDTLQGQVRLVVEGCGVQNAVVSCPPAWQRYDTINKDSE